MQDVTLATTTTTLYVNHHCNFQALVKALESSSHRRNTVSDCNKVRVDLEIPRTSPNSTSNLVQKKCARPNEKTARASFLRSTTRAAGELSRPASDSMLMKKRQNKSNTVTVLVIIG